MSYRTINRFRKAHRFLGVFIGIQFLFWTISGLYFSWTNLDEIHGDHYTKAENSPAVIQPVIADTLLRQLPFPLHSLKVKAIGGEPFFWVNDSLLLSPLTGQILPEISKEQALEVVKKHLLPQYKPQKVERITAVGPHDEYRGRPLPAFRISLSGKGNPVAYVAARSGEFQRVRHTQWRWFDFLWMTHTMDYQGRDKFNTLLLRAFSLFGLITVLSGFALAFVTSSWRKKIKR
ncbi:MAG: hypothetical protein ACPG8F_04150 [Flavobacteriaceae bacterium]